MSAEYARFGHGNWIYSHESTHDTLMKTTTVGQVQLTLSLLLGDLFPDGGVKQRAVELMSELARHMWKLQEGTATYAADCFHSGPDVPDAYRAAAATFQWITDRFEFPAARFFLARLLARRAAQTSILESWVADSLWEPDRLRRHLSLASSDPAHRLNEINSAVQRLSDEQILEGLDREGRSGDTLALTWQPEVDGVPFYQPRKQAGLDAFVRTFATDVYARADPADPGRDALGPLIDDPGGVIALVPSSVSLVVTSCSRQDIVWGRPEETLTTLHGADRIIIVANPVSKRLPWSQRTDDTTMWIEPGEAILECDGSETSEVLLRADVGDLPRLMRAVREDTTVCVLDRWYDFDAGDVLGVAALRERRHVVLVQNPVYSFVRDLSHGLAGGRHAIAVSFVPDDVGDLGFILLRPGTRRPPLVLIPTLTDVGEEMLAHLMRLPDDWLEISYIPDMQVLGFRESDFIDLYRVILWLVGLRSPRDPVT